MNRGKPPDMGQGNVGRTLLRLALPSVVSMFFHTLFHLVDTIFIAWLGEAPLAAMSLTYPVMFAAFALFNGIGVGNTSLVSRSLGAGNEREASETAQAACQLALLVSIPPMVLLDRELSAAFFTLLGGSGPVLAESYGYNTWLVAGFPLMAMSLVLDSVFRSQGDTVTPMVSMVAGNMLNVLLDPVFIFWLDQGIAGASLATFIGRGVSCIYLAWRLKSHCRIRLHWALPGRGFSTRAGLLLRTGLPVSVSQGSVALGSALLNRIMSRFGAAALGAWMLGNRVEGLVFLPAFGINGALIPFIGFNLGKKDVGRIRQAIRAAGATSAVLMVALGILVYAWPKPILSLFRPDPVVMDLAVASIRASATAYLLASLDITFWGVFQGAGHAGWGMAAQFVRTVLVRVPAALWLSGNWGLHGLWWCQPLSVLASFSVSCVLLRHLLRKLDKETAKVAAPKEPVDNHPGGL